MGKYVDGLLDLDLGKVRFRMNEPDAPVSVCSQPCERGQAKSFLEGEKCCFHCINCTKYQYLAEETNCADCPSGTLPGEDKSKCVPIPGKFLAISQVIAREQFSQFCNLSPSFARGVHAA